MKTANEEIGSGKRRLGASDFQHEVLEKLGRLETKVDMIVGNGQPGRMKLAEDRVVVLEHNDLRRAVYDRIVIAGITFAVTLAISMIVAGRSYLGLK
ncbi:MAG: hypothetical protein ACLPVW_07070 [Terriglobales bacterium]